MPKKYENKSNHNTDFLNTLNNDYPEEYFDWKVTVQFYSCLHRCYCVLITKTFTIEQSHMSNIKNLKIVNSDLSRKLYTLYKNSRQARYDGFISEDAMYRINRINFQTGTKIMASIGSECSKYYPVPI